MKVLLDAPREPVPQPAPPTPGVGGITLPPPAAPTPPGSRVTEGRRAVQGTNAWKSVREEIERELTEDAELEITWRIVKKRQ